MQETQVQFLGQKEPMEKEMATHSSILAWRTYGQRSLAGCSLWGHKGWTQIKTKEREDGHSFSSKEQVSFNFMVAVTIYSDLGAPQNKVCHYFHCFTIYLPLNDGTGCRDLSFLNVEF